MPAKKAARKKTGRPELGKKTVSIRLHPKTVVAVRTATVATGNMSAWIEDAIERKLASNKT